jgi:hypothetical protein
MQWPFSYVSPCICLPPFGNTVNARHFAASSRVCRRPYRGRTRTQEFLPMHSKRMQSYVFVSALLAGYRSGAATDRMFPVFFDNASVTQDEPAQYIVTRALNVAGLSPWQRRRWRATPMMRQPERVASIFRRIAWTLRPHRWSPGGAMRFRSNASVTGMRPPEKSAFQASASIS